MPLFHIHGLVGGLLASLAAHASFVATPDFNVDQFFDWMREFRPTWYTAVPAFHQAILGRSRDQRKRSQKAGSGLSALPPRRWLQSYGGSGESL